MDKPANSQ